MNHNVAGMLVQMDYRDLATYIGKEFAFLPLHWSTEIKQYCKYKRLKLYLSHLICNWCKYLNKYLLTVFSPPDLSSNLISENCKSDGSARKLIIFRVSPSALLTEIVLSSEPRASRFSLFHEPHVIFLVCFPITGIRLK